MLKESTVLVTTICLVIALTIGCFFTERWPRFSGNVSSLFPYSSPTKNNLDLVQKYFGGSEVDVVLVTLEQKQQQDSLSFLVDDLLELDNVLRVTAPSLESKDFPISLLTEDRRYGRLLLELDTQVSDQERYRLDQALQVVLDKYSYLDPQRTGQFTLTEAVTRKVTSVTLELVPFAAVVLLVFLAILFGSLVFAIQLLLVPALAFIVIMLLSALCGSSFGPISQLLPSFLLAVGTSYSVHVATRTLEASVGKEEETYDELKEAVSLAGLTTVVGVLSLLLLKVKGVTEFALPAALGVFLCCLYALVLSRGFANKYRSRVLSSERSINLFRFDPTIFIKPILVALLLLLAVFSAPGLSKLQFAINLDSFLPIDADERVSLKKVEENFPGNHFLDLVLRYKNDKLVVSDTIVKDLKNNLIDIPEVLDITTALDFERYQNLNDSLDLSMFQTSDKSVQRLLIETSVQGRSLLDLKESLMQKASEIQGLHSYELAISSVELLLAEQASTLLKGVIQSLLVTLLIVLVLLACIFRNVLVVCIGLIPNVVPVATVFGISGLLLSEVNIGTAVAGAIALAIAADDTFHLLCCWKEHSKFQTMPEAAVSSIRTTFSAMLTTSIVLSSVFLVVGTSDVEPIRHYGFLITGMLFMGLCSDLVLVPYFLGKLSDS